VFTAGGTAHGSSVSAPTYSPQTSDDVAVHEGREAEFSQLIAAWPSTRSAATWCCQSRQQRPLTPYFPEITAAIAAQIPVATVLDGELVVYRGGRCDFAALHRRVSARPRLTCAASLVVFDILALAGRDLRGLPHRKRRKRLHDSSPTPRHRSQR
jgi:ATP dependent DNA ligase domain